MDYKDQYADLTKKMEHALPLTAYPIRELIQVFKTKAKPITLKSKLTISAVINSGDISGILCKIEDADKNIIACSLNHLVFPPDSPLYKDIIDYQQKRQKRINQLNHRGY